MIGNTADVIVIGVGAVGAATLYQLAKRGVDVIGIDRFSPPHDQGSSHGESRVTRQATGEGDVYVPFALRSHEIWRELESASGTVLLDTCGFLAIDGSDGHAVRHGRQGFFDTTVDVARRFGIRHEILSVAETAHRYPAFNLTGAERIYFEPDAGMVFPERAIAAQIEQARIAGARLRVDETVLSVVVEAGRVVVRTTRATYHAARVVMAAGAWTPGLIGAQGTPLKLLRQTLHWFAPAAAHFSAGLFPTFLWLDGPRAEDSFYGFPAMAGSSAAVKVATEQFTDASATPEHVARTVDPAESDAMYRRYVADRLLGLGDHLVRSLACIYTHAPDGNFVIDHAADGDQILVVSACSGHGFKHSAAIGEYVADVIDRSRPLDPRFSLSRPAFAAMETTGDASG